MKKILKKVVASVAILSMIGAGSSAMAEKIVVLPSYDRVGNRISYRINKDTGITAVIRVGTRVNYIRINNKNDVLRALGYMREGERNFPYLYANLPSRNVRGNELIYSLAGNIVSVSLWKDGVPTAPKVVGRYDGGVVYFTRDGLRTIFGV